MPARAIGNQVIGAGYIAVELAGVLHELGSDTWLFCRGDLPLRGFDDILSKTLADEMVKAGLNFRSKSTPKARPRLDALIGLKLRPMVLRAGDPEGSRDWEAQPGAGEWGGA
jgi:hypothetical protein